MRVLRIRFGFLAIAAACLPAGFSSIGATSRARAAETLVPADFRSLQDAQGFTWQVAPNGALGSDPRGALNHAFAMSVGGTQANFSQPQMSPDGTTYVFTGFQHQQISVTRRIHVDLKQSTVQFVDSFKNQSPQTQSLTVALQTQLGNPAQTIVNEKGTTGGSSSSSRGLEFIAVGQNGVPSVVFHFGTSKAKNRPSIGMQSNYRILANVPVSIPAGKTVSFVYGLAMASNTGVPDAKAAANLLKPFAGSSWQRSVPSELRGTVTNGTGGGFSYVDAIDQFQTPDALTELGVERGPHDQLLAGQATRLRGSLSAGIVTIETKRGPKKLTLDRIAAFIGGNQQGRVPRVVLRDGQVLVGALEIPELKFTLNSGLDVTCEPANLDRFVLKERPDDGKPGADVFCYIDSLEGDRLAVKQGDRQTIKAVTNWGDVDIGLDEIDVWTSGSTAQGRITDRLLLRDGSTFTALTTDAPLQLATVEYGMQTWAVSDIRRLYGAHRSTSIRKDPSAPHVIALGDNLFVGQVDLPLLHVSVQGQVVPVVPTQLKLLKREEGENAPGAQGLSFKVELWDGDVVVGSIVEQTIPIRSVGGKLEIPVSDLVELRVPTPTVPDSLRTRITELIADLGHAEWARREAAGKELRSLGGTVREQCEDALKATNDQEVRKRLQALLDALKDE